MAKKGIPDDIKEQVDEIVRSFNEEFMDPDCVYVTRYRGKFLYLDRNEYGQIGSICRLEYTGDMNNWDFAIYKYSSERYDAEEWFFPGTEHVDGTIEGAMKAGLEAYPD